MAFGDLFLEDIRACRECRLQETGMKGVFLPWHRKIDRLAGQFIDFGFRAVTCCVDSKRLARDFCGVSYGRDFLDRLPRNVDPCGENGRFHTFVFDGPLSEKLDFSLGEFISREDSTWRTLFRPDEPRCDRPFGHYHQAGLDYD